MPASLCGTDDAALHNPLAALVSVCGATALQRAQLAVLVWIAELSGGDTRCLVACCMALTEPVHATDELRMSARAGLWL